MLNCCYNNDDDDDGYYCNVDDIVDFIGDNDRLLLLLQFNHFYMSNIMIMMNIIRNSRTRSSIMIDELYFRLLLLFLLL